jgi:IMP dehydrogenase/GMP reductase
MNDANIENNTANQPSSKKWGPWKIAAAVTAGIIAVGGVAGAVVGALYVTGNLSFGPADTAKDLMSRDVSNTTVLNNGTTPAHTEASTSEAITSYFSGRLSEVATTVTDAISSTVTDAISSTYQQFTTTMPTATNTPSETTSLETTTLNPCGEEAKENLIKDIEKNNGGIYSVKGREVYLRFLKNCHKGAKRN